MGTKYLVTAVLADDRVSCRTSDWSNFRVYIHQTMGNLREQ